MARTESFMLPLNTEAPNFSLTNGVDNIKVTLDKVKGRSGTLVIFMCNHCPYVLHILDKMVEVSHDIKKLGINTVAISSNDVENYPDDRPELMKKLAYRGRFDNARPKNDNPVTGKDLMNACQKLSKGAAQETDQIPSLGCNIKWKAGNEPNGFLSI